MSTSLIYRGALYRKAATPPILDVALMGTAWKALQSTAKTLQDTIQKFVDLEVKDTNKTIAKNFAAVQGLALAEDLFNALITELAAGIGGSSTAEKKRLADMATALQAARTSGIITDAHLIDIFGWQVPTVKAQKYTNMQKYYDPADRYGKAYLDTVVASLEKLL
jgi:hypothetical protein